MVAAYSIRHRILKVSAEKITAGTITAVAAYSIRHRILKDFFLHRRLGAHDKLQPIRSDTGY